ncbi:ribonuclease H-like domain-containing protein [Aspergillus granulosus]|uniref:Ribonuclease H-like domain-containing protein n=1 Tax=Aspergillus granulosus TaxID=176169 RepID=A0ABR4GXZ3_9EURO
MGKCMTRSLKTSENAARFLSSWSWTRPGLAATGKSQHGDSSNSKNESLQPGSLKGQADSSLTSQSTAKFPLVSSQASSPDSKPTNDISSEFWSHRLFKSRSGDEIAVHYCQTLESTEQVAQLFLNDTLLGFDMEWQPEASRYDSIQDNVSLIQLANRDRIALFHISKFQSGETREHLVSPTLKRILESPDITKAGVAIRSDSTRLRTFLGINPRGTFELSHLYRLVKYFHQPSEINKRLVGMSKQVDEHFGLPLMKDRSVRCSNWSSSLTDSQVHCEFLLETYHL